jgi:hypothetical protein
VALTAYFVDPAINGNSGTGTIGDPYGDLQYALNTVTRDATNGDIFHVKAGTAEVLAAALTLATYGTPTAAAPLVLRGYTSAANDGGVGEINCNGVTMWAATTYDFVTLIDLEMHTFGNNNGVGLRNYCHLVRCEVHKGASTPSGKTLVNLSGYVAVVGCYIHDGHTNSTSVAVSTGALVAHNYLAGFDGAGISTNNAATITGNIINLGANVSSGGIVHASSNPTNVIGNVIYSSVANTGIGINVGNSSGRYCNLVINNIVIGFSGVGGDGITGAAGSFAVVAGYNAYYNNTTNNSIPVTYNDLGNDVSLSADPFTDAANGDFSLTAAAKTALRSLGWPASYLGAHANTDPHITIGPLQYGPTPAASGVVRRVARLLGG